MSNTAEKTLALRNVISKTGALESQFRYSGPKPRSKEAAKACELLNPKCIIPMHFETFPALTGSPVELKNFLPTALKSKVVDILPGDTVN